MAWLDHTPRYFGKFDSQAQAEKWIAEHRSLAKQHQELEPDQAPPDSERVIK
jgi:hypothetical protein